MHPIQEKLLELSKMEGFATMSLRDMATALGMPDSSPQKMKHHLSQLERKGFFTLNKSKGYVTHALKQVTGMTSNGSHIFSIPIIGVANCGPANVFAETNFQGFLKVSSRLLSRSTVNGLYAVKADGASMNSAQINGKILEDNDYAIIDSNQKSPSNKEVVLAIIDDKATIKRFIDDRANGQIVLMADSSYDYEPIYLHEDDNFNISGKVIDIIKRPNLK
ncbi:MAG: hypothetical protein IPI46_14280 [Bacteroidetes bacterium]|nr:hypothetical protein [Bacteroidota bacterium]